MNTPFCFSRPFAAFLAAMLSCIGAHTVSAQATIGINFSATTYTVSSAAQPGIVAGANWNNVAGGSGSSITLVDNSGATTTARLTFSSQGAYNGFTTPMTSNSATNTLYRGGIYGGSSEVSITLTGIPFAQYNVYVFASADDSANNTLSISSGGTTYYYRSSGSDNSAATSLLLVTSTSAISPTTGPATYEQFLNQTGSSFSAITGGSINGSISNNVFGLQIVAVPEPATEAMILGVGALGVGLLVRRNRSMRSKPTTLHST